MSSSFLGQASLNETNTTAKSKSALVIGGGIAGASVAYFLAKAGWQITLIDAEFHAASQVPSALINPVRGQSGGVDTKALAGMQFTWQLIAQLTAAGYVIPHGQTGVLRPIPDQRVRERFERNLPTELNHQWLEPNEFPTQLADNWPSALWLPEGGWVDGAAFSLALKMSSGAHRINQKALAWNAKTVTLANGQTLEADAVVWCGGSVGRTWAAQPAIHRAGSMLLLHSTPSPFPLSFGVYLAPSANGGVLGATFEAPAPQWQAPAFPLHSGQWLLAKAALLTPLSGLQAVGQWTGSRLSGLLCGQQHSEQQHGEQQHSGHWNLSGLSSKGFLLGPLLAQKLVADLTGRAE